MNDDEFRIGDEFYWLHGDCHIVATVIAVGNTRVQLSGLTKDYWIKKETLLKKINKPYPVGGSIL